MKNQRKELSQTLIDLQVKEFDVIIIGGGATGLGCALDATLRGYSTLLLEKDDFASGTSSKSTKLIHGGVRYLEQMDIPLVVEALRERSLLLKNAPEIVKPLSFLIPSYSIYERPYYFVGLKMYELLARGKGIKTSKVLSKETTIKKFSNIKSESLKGSIQYFDAIFDDALLAMSIMRSTIENGGICVNYCNVLDLEKDKEGKLSGVRVVDKIENQILHFKSKTIINATGIFSNEILWSDNPETPKRIITSRGSHIVVPQSKFPSNHALLIPKTRDGRIVFAVPWYDKTIIGTTDIKDAFLTNQPKVSMKEIEFILETVNEFLDSEIDYNDITSTFCGLRPLVKSKIEASSKAISRNHQMQISKSGMISIMGGKWTTYRSMAEDTIDFAIKNNMLGSSVCKTKDFHLNNPNKGQALLNGDKLNEALISDMIEKQMVTSLADILSRRTRYTLLDVEKSRKYATIISKYCVENKININANLDDYLEFTEAFDFRM